MIDFDQLMSMTPEQREAAREALDAKRGARAGSRPAATAEAPPKLEKFSDVEAAIKRGARALARREKLDPEVAFAKFARTPEGERLKGLYATVPDDLEDDPRPAPVRKVGPGGTGKIAQEARRIAKARGISEEAAYAHLDAAFIEKHRGELPS